MLTHRQKFLTLTCSPYAATIQYLIRLTDLNKTVLALLIAISCCNRNQRTQSPIDFLKHVIANMHSFHFPNFNYFAAGGGGLILLSRNVFAS